jgi:hypothetical protein
VKQLGILSLHLGEFVFLADDDEHSERVWADEASALADLRKEEWEITSGPAQIKPDLPEKAGRNIVGYRLERSVQ